MTSATGGDTTSGLRRDPFWDNAKAVLVTLVVVGHALAPLASHSPAADVLYRWIYTFHMPAFVFVTGVLTAELTRGRAGRLVTAVLVPYAIFQTLQWLGVSLLEGDAAHWQLLTPRWTLWYLVATVLWRLSAPLWLALRPWAAVALALAVMVASAIGPGAGHVLGLDDALGFLPFFVAGLLLRDARVPRLLDAPWARAGAVVVLAGAAVAAVLTRHVVPRSFLSSAPADDLGFTDARTAVLRLAFTALAAACVAAVLALVPRSSRRWTTVGVASMYVYLLHPLVLLWWRTSTFADSIGRVWEVAVVVLVAIAIAFALATGPVRLLTRWAVEPSWSWSPLLGGSGRDAPTHRTGSGV